MFVEQSEGELPSFGMLPCLRVVLAATLLATCCQSQTPSPSTPGCAEIDADTVARLASSALQPEEALPVTINVINFTIVCSVAGKERNTFLQTSVVVEYTCEGEICPPTPALIQLEFTCIESLWAQSVILSEPPAADASLQTAPRTDCGACLDFVSASDLLPLRLDGSPEGYDPITHCASKLKL